MYEMSVTNPNKIMYRINSYHWKNDSGELDVFEATRYFSSANEIPVSNFSQKFIKEDRHQHQQVRKGARMSLDMIMRNSFPQNHEMDQKKLKGNKKWKQPSSPGGRLASFLNSLFNQTSSKKCKPKPVGTNNSYLEEESPDGIRKRRSSISHFRTTTTTTTATTVDSKSMYSSSSSGFRTPPLPYAYTPTKSGKELSDFLDHQKLKNGGILKPKSLLNEFYSEKRNTDHYPWIGEKFRFHKKDNSSAVNWSDEYPSEEREFRKFSDADDGADTDSSSDLFDLPNHELDFYANDLPVYETTDMNSIRSGPQI